MDNEQFQDLKKRVDHIQFGDIKDINNTINGIKVEQASISILTEQNTKAYEKLTNTMSSVQKTMIEMAEAMKNSNTMIVNLNEKFDNMKETMESKFEEVDNRIIEVDNKSKIDIAIEQTKSVKDFIQKYGGWILGGTGCGVMIIFEIIKTLS